jgi:site-specific DNA recombinase
MSTAIIYARVSTGKQAEEELPIESQLEQCRERARALGCQVLKEFVDRGISGRTDSRPAFQSAIDYCVLHKVDKFITWSTSRFMRNKQEAFLHKRALRKNGTDIVFLNAEIDPSTTSGFVLESIYEMLDELKSRETAADTLRSQMKNARDGNWNGGKPPFGFKVVPNGRRKRLELDEVQAPIAKMIFRLALDGKGSLEIARRLNSIGLTNRGSEWRKSSIAYMLASPVYAGMRVFGRVDENRRARPMEDWVMVQCHDTIITVDEWKKLQAEIASRAPDAGSGSPKSQHVFTGMLECGECGARLMIETATGRSKIYSYYNCSAFLKGKSCVSRRLPAGDLDEWLQSEVLARILTRDVVSRIANDVQAMAGSWESERNEKLSAVSSELRDVSRRLQGLYDVIELNGRDAPNLADVTERLRELQARKARLAEAVRQLENSQAPEIRLAANDVDEIASGLRGLVIDCYDVARKRNFFASFLKRAVVSGESIRLDYAPDALLCSAPGTVHSGIGWLPGLISLRTAKLLIELPSAWQRRAA